MIRKTLISASLLSVIAIVAAGASSAQADDQRWGDGRSQWQPQTHSGWFDNNRGDDRDRGWDRDRNSGRDRNTWSRSRRNDDHQWRGRQDRQEHDRGRHQGWQRNGRNDNHNRSWR